MKQEDIIGDLSAVSSMLHKFKDREAEDLVHDLCDALISAGSPFRWACNSHVRNLFQKPKLVKKMKDAGCWMIDAKKSNPDKPEPEKI